MNASVWNKKCIFSPSLICLDLCNIERQVKELEECGCDMLHVDILDGYFSPSMPIGLDVVRQLRAKTSLPLDVHLMVKEQDFFVNELLNIGVEQLVFHAESEAHIDNRLNQIHAAGARAGVALKPATSLNALDYVLEKCDTVLLMLINPGYAGSAKEKQATYAARKINELKSLITTRETRTKIEIDGRISPENIHDFAMDTVDIFVTGSTCVKRNDIKGSMRALETLRQEILGVRG